MEFLDALDRIKAEEASPAKLFGGVTPKAESRWLKQRIGPAKYATSLSEAATFMADIYAGRRRIYQFSEAMGTDDFPILFGDIIDRQMLGSYASSPNSWMRYARRGRVRDFRTVKRFYMDGLEGVLTEPSPMGEYSEASLSDAKYEYAVSKYGRRVPLTWEAMINDDLDAFQTIPSRLGRAAARTEEDFATRLFVDASGPKTSTFTAIPSNPALSIAALQSAMSVALTQTDADSEPITIQRWTLVVPPQLQVTASNVLNAIEIRAMTSGGGTTAQTLVARNWAGEAGITSAVTNFYIPQIATTANGDTSWFLIADPAEGRPAMEVGFLIGHESPELFRKASNAVRVGGGGEVDPMDGDFDNDNIHHKVRHVVGGVMMDIKMVVASNGSGS